MKGEIDLPLLMDKCGQMKLKKLNMEKLKSISMSTKDMDMDAAEIKFLLYLNRTAFFHSN
jgi:hypothetical protein